MYQPIPITIVGSGITGLATAYHLIHTHASQYAITIIAHDLPGDLTTSWASPWAGAIFQPLPTPNPIHQKMQITSFTFYHKLASTHPSSETGVKIYPATEYFDAFSINSSTPDASNAFIRDLMPNFVVMPEEELPKGTGVTSGVRYTSLAINPTFFLSWLKKQLEGKGVKFIRAKVGSLAAARSLTAEPPKIIINASGVGAKELAGDESVLPIRGQTMFIKSNFGKLMIREGSEYTYVIPRPHSGGVIIGGVKQPGRVDEDVDVDVRVDILRRVNALVDGAFGDVKLDEGDESDRVKDIVGFRPGREGGLRVERELVTSSDENERGLNVIHAYGVSGGGYIYSFGVAERVGELVEESINGSATKS